MEISGKIIVATEPRTGTSARTGSKWVAQDFVIETHEQYPKRCVFGVFGEDRLREFNINVGDELTVSFDIDAHEYNGRWFNSLRAWRVQRASDAVAADAQANGAAAIAIPAPDATPAPTAPAAPEVSPTPSTSDDLPF